MALSRYQFERAFHDSAAAVGRARAVRFYAAGALDEADALYWQRVIASCHGTVLELGCGPGSSLRALRPDSCRLILSDISFQMCRRAREVAGKDPAGGRVSVVQTAAEALPFAGGSVDLVIGHSVLHHLDLCAAEREMLRVLAPGGRAVFLEPLGHNPLLWLYRRLTREERTRDERPLRMQDVEALAAKFSAARHTEFGFTTLGLVVLRVLLRRPRLWPRLLNLLSAADRTLAELLPFIREFYWVTVIELER